MQNQYYLKKVQITNFRNLQDNLIEFNNNINCIFGMNGNGKTNLLEAIYFILNRKSFRKKTSFPQIISVEAEDPQILISSVFEKNEELFPYSGRISEEQNEWYWNNKLVKRKKILECLFVSPSDSIAFHTTPSFRRNWFDTQFSMLSSEYKQILANFNSALRFRNHLLAKKPLSYLEQIQANEPNFIKLSAELSNLRVYYLEQIGDFITQTFKLLFNEVHNLSITLESKIKQKSFEELAQFYQQESGKDQILGHTKNGAHRDDYLFEFDGYNSYEYCSLGQQKMSFLSLLFAYIELFRYKFKTYPMVLLDDVSGELDRRRWGNLISYLEAKKFQVFISTANENFKERLEEIEGASKIFLSDGNMEVQ